MIGVSHCATGLQGRALWHPLRGGAPDTVISGLDGYRTGAGVLLDGGSAALVASAPETDTYECWLVGLDGSARKLGAAGQGERMYLIRGTLGGRAYVLSVAAEPDGQDRCTLSRVIPEEGRLDPVDLIAAAPK